MQGKKKVDPKIMIIGAVVVVAAAIFAYMNMEKIEIMVKKTAGSESKDLLALAMAAEEAGNTHKALEYYEGFVSSASESDPELGNAYGGIGNIYFKQFKYHKAIQNLQKALDHSTQYIGKNSQEAARHWFSLASIYDKQGEVKKALSHYKNSRAIKAKLGVDTDDVDRVIDELEDYMVNANLQTTS